MIPAQGNHSILTNTKMSKARVSPITETIALFNWYVSSAMPVSQHAQYHDPGAGMQSLLMWLVTPVFKKPDCLQRESSAAIWDLPAVILSQLSSIHMLKCYDIFISHVEIPPWFLALDCFFLHLHFTTVATCSLQLLSFLLMITS